MKPVLKFDIKTENTLDSVQMMLKVFMLLNQIHLCKSEVQVLATLIIMRPTVKTRRHIMKEMKIYSQQSSYYNTIHKLKRLKLIYEDEDRNFIINPSIDLNEGSLGMVVRISVKDDKQDEEHKPRRQ